MPVYNGSQYLKDQLASILKQLAVDDQVVIIDDASTDNTMDIIGEFDDHRLVVLNNDGNMGVIASVEKAIQTAEGELIFLSDQDDIWLDGKVEAIKQVFREDLEVTLVVSDAVVIDEKDQIVSDSFYLERSRFVPGVISNFIKNKYMGCTMAFRSDMREYILPIPGNIPMHDVWIGILNNIYGKCYFIDKPLVAYRRHRTNTSKGRQRLPQIIVWRWRLVRDLLRRCIRRRGTSADLID